MSLGSPLLMFYLLNILVEAAILTASIAILYCACATLVNDQLERWYIYSRKYMDSSNSYSAAVAVQYQNGAKYWKAYTCTYAGLGGIMVTNSISLEEARNIVLANEPSGDVFAVQYSDAAFLASTTFTGYFNGPEAHRMPKGIPQPMNHQHIHAVTGYNNGEKVSGHVHIFFAIPFIV